MHTINREPLGKGINSTNSIIFSCGVGVQSPVTTQILWRNVINLAKNPQNVEKSRASWILPSSLPSRKAQEQEQNGQFGLLWADIDDMQGKSIDELYDTLDMPYALIYTTKSATSENPRCRVLVPLSYQLEFSDWLICQNKLNSRINKLGVEVDDCNLKSSQILFLPNRGEHYQAILPQTHKRGNPVKWIAQDKEAQPTVASISSIQPRTAPARGGVIDRFKAAFSVADILQQAGYKQNPYNPLQWRHPASESGSFSASISPETGRVHSLSSRDPLWTGGGGVGAHDAFGAFCVLFCDNNLKKAVYRAANEWLIKEVAHG